MRKKITAQPLVSVVMPSLNQVQFIEAAIRSVLEQDYENIELIVADGMSSDGTIKKLIDLQNEYGYQRLRWASQKDNGPAQAINHAISLAAGDVIGWLNSDDMYTQGAISRAIEHFTKSPKHQMVYGKGQHIDSIGRILSNYSTKTPSQPLDNFGNGSFICQPTVFMRREALKEVGELDPKISTAFDFDLFIRFFKRYPRQIGLINRIQAFSRIHPGCITHRLRKQIALDAMHVIFKELGTVPEHWFWTHIDEILNAHPFESNGLLPTNEITDFFKSSSQFYTKDKLNKMVERLNADMRIKLARPGVGISVEPDGWICKETIVKYKSTKESQEKYINLKCSGGWPEDGDLKIKIEKMTGESDLVSIKKSDNFLIRLEIPDYLDEFYFIWKIISKQSFKPSLYNSENKDNRKLTFLIKDIYLDK